MTYGLELTFLPRADPNGFKTETETSKVVRKFNSLLKPVNNPQETGCSVFLAKEESLGDNYCIEVVNFINHIASREIEDEQFRDRLSSVFNIADYLRLTARASKTEKGIRLEYASGGSHIQHSMNVFGRSHSPCFLNRLACFERNMCSDYANRPYIRWLFAQWFDNTNSLVMFNLDDLPKSGIIKKNPIYKIYSDWCTHIGIVPRFTGIRRGCIPTYEHRYFDATQTADETIDNLKFIQAWIGSLAERTENGLKIKSKLTRSYFKSLKNTRFAWKEISQFLLSLALNPNCYRPNFERNYITRMKFGQMV